MEQAHADQPPVVIDALDRVPVQFELGHDGGWKVNSTRVQLGESDGLVAGLAQALEQPLLLGVSKRHRRIVTLQRGCGRAGAHVGWEPDSADAFSTAGSDEASSSLMGSADASAPVGSDQVC